MGYVYAIVSTISFAVLATTYKLSDRLDCNKRQVNFFLFLTGAVIVFFVAHNYRVLVLLPSALGLGGILGAIGFINIMSFREAAARGRLSTSWPLISMSLVIPILASIFIWHETPTLRHYVGFVLILFAILLLVIDIKKASE